MRCLYAAIVLACMLPGCVLVRVADAPATSKAADEEVTDPNRKLTATAEATVAASAALADAAQLEQDPTAAASKFLAARERLLVDLAALSNPPSLVDALNTLNPEQRSPGSPMQHAAQRVLWRTFIGRSKALQSLGRTLELPGETPSGPSNGGECPPDLREQCVAHLVEMAEALPHSFGEAKSQTVGQPRYYERRTVDLRGSNGPSFLHERIDLKKRNGIVLVRVTPQEVQSKTDGVMLVSRTKDQAFTGYSDCRKNLGVDDQNRLVVEERCATATRDVLRGGTISIVLPSDAPTSKPVAQRRPPEYLLSVDLAALSGSAASRAYTFKKAHVVANLSASFVVEYATRADGAL